MNCRVKLRLTYAPYTINNEWINNEWINEWINKWINELIID